MIELPLKPLVSPIIGVFVPRKHVVAFTKRERPRDPDEDLLYDHVKYSHAAQSRGILLYFFSQDDVNLERRLIYGWLLSRRRGWHRRVVPWPHFVYNLAKGNAGKERKAKLIKADRRFIWLNDIRSFRKWHTHTLLRDKATRLLPDTVLGGSWHDLKHMLKQHKVVLTKPDNGTWGYGISKIWQGTDGLCNLETTDGMLLSGLSVEQAYAKASGYADGETFVIQQMLKLLPVGPSLSVIRLMLGKDRNNQWQVLQWYMCLGRPGAFVSNWHQGASEVDVIPGLLAAGLARDIADKIFAQAKQVATKIASTLEDCHQGHMVEVGLDFGIDTDLNLWLLEANGWPEKGEVEHDPDPIPRVYSCIVDYAMFLWANRQAKRK